MELHACDEEEICTTHTYLSFDSYVISFVCTSGYVFQMFNLIKSFSLNEDLLFLLHYFFSSNRIRIRGAAFIIPSSLLQTLSLQGILLFLSFI